jgi:hypothetical protein
MDASHVAFLYGADEQTCLLLIKRGVPMWRES